MNPAVVVIAYNRPAALQRLLDSLLRATYGNEPVPLLISIDRGPDGVSPEVLRVVQDFEWPHGPKQVIEQPQRLGVVGHFRAAGRLSAEFGSIVLLEDDLAVSPAYHDFASQSLERYAEDERIAAVCLYGLWFNGFTRLPFQPVEDGGDVFFLRLPYTQGLAFTARQWQQFEAAWPAGTNVAPHPALHQSFLRFGPDEWFPAFARYLAVTGRFVCYPRVSLTLGWGDAGAHFDRATAWLQTPVQLAGRDFRLPTLDDSLAVYDSFYELLPDRLLALGANLPADAFDVDLNATKSLANRTHDLVLTTRPVRRAEASFGLQVYPPEVNVVQGAPGDAISLARVEDVYWDRVAEMEARRKLEAYSWARRQPSRRRTLVYEAARLVQRLRRRA